GSHHPLAHAAEALAAARRQSIAVTAALTVSVAATCAGAKWTPGIAVSAGIVLVGLIVICATDRQRESDRALDRIIQGRESLPVAAAQRHRQPLLAPRRRPALAGAIEPITEQAAARPRLRTRGTAPLFDIRAVASVTAELTAITELLRGSPPARG